MVVINRDNGFKDEITFTLRMLNLDISTSKLIVNRLKSKFLIEETITEKEKSLILIENIDIYNDFSEIFKIIDDKIIDRSNVNVFVSLTTQCDISGFTLPENISNLYIRFGGSIDFSVISWK